MTNDKLFFIVVHWGDPELTKKALQSLYVASGARIVVVENGSNSFVSDSGVEMVRLPENLGYAAGANAGLKYALTQGAQSMIVMNNDLEYRLGAVEKMLIKMKGRVGCVGAIVDEGDGSPVFGGGKINWFRGRSYLALSNNDAQDLDYISGAFLLLSRECIEKVGFLPEKYFHTWEDVAYSFEIKRCGWQFDWAETPVLKHLRSQSLGDSRLKTYYLVRNGSLFAREYASPLTKAWLESLEPLRLKWAEKNKKWEVKRGLLDARVNVTGRLKDEDLLIKAI